MLATRKPLLLFRFPVSFLLRIAERRFLGLLSQEPPRRTRLRQGDDQASERYRTIRPERSHGADAMLRGQLADEAATRNVGTLDVLCRHLCRREPICYS